MKRLLVPYDGGDAARAALVTALTLAQKNKGQLEGLFIKQLPPIIAGEGITLPGDYITQLVEDGKRQAEIAEKSFNEAVGPYTSSVVTSWQTLEGNSAQIVGEHGRLFDMIIVGRNTDKKNGDWRGLCEGALFESGRPVLVTQEPVTKELGDKVTVAWNGSTETARTIAMIMSTLKAAQTVQVVEVEGNSVSGPNAEQVSNYLRCHGIDADSKMIDATGKGPGEAIIDQAQTWGADLLVKGAYTHSRLRQLIFGGATSEILSDAPMPVVLCH